MPTRLSHRKIHLKKGKGIKEFVENIGNKIKSGAKSVHNWLQEKKPISRVQDVPLQGSAIKSTGVGIPLWLASKIGGYGKSKKNKKGGGRHRKVGRPKK